MIPFLNARGMALAGVVLIHLSQWIYYYPQLPNRMATHFNGVGEADGWMTRDGLTLLNLGFLGLALFLGYLLPWLMRFMPVSLVNVPNKQYWSAPERWPVAEQRIAVALQWLAVLLYSWLIAINQLTLWANLHPPPRLGTGFWYMLGAYLIGMIAWIICLYRAFRTPRP